MSSPFSKCQNPYLVNRSVVLSSSCQYLLWCDLTSLSDQIKLNAASNVKITGQGLKKGHCMLSCNIHILIEVEVDTSYVCLYGANYCKDVTGNSKLPYFLFLYFLLHLSFTLFFFTSLLLKFRFKLLSLTWIKECFQRTSQQQRRERGTKQTD